MRIAIGSDHAGFVLKTALKEWLESEGYDVNDCGAYSDERVDYPVFGAKVGEVISAGNADFGVLVCGSGQGICMAANKITGIRAGVIRDDWDAEMTRRHNDANVACFGERVTEPASAIASLRVFLSTEFEGGRHESRVELLGALDEGAQI
jgi:ribose 5-phosphate isomerase B